MSDRLRELRNFFEVYPEYGTVEQMELGILMTLDDCTDLRARAIALRWAHELAGSPGF